MDQISRTRSLDYSIFKNVFRSEKVKESPHDQIGSPQSSDLGQSFDQLRTRNRSLSHSFCFGIDEERDDNDSDIPHIPNIFLSSEYRDSSHDCLISDARDPEDDECRLQRDARSNDHDERTGAQPMVNEMLGIARRSQAENDRSSHEFLNDRSSHEFLNDRSPQEFLSCISSGLKRANPIYESESEAEIYLQPRARTRRRSDVGLGESRVGPTPLYWTERLSVE
jgi:hypothetical protein